MSIGSSAARTFHASSSVRWCTPHALDVDVLDAGRQITRGARAARDLAIVDDAEISGGLLAHETGRARGIDHLVARAPLTSAG